MSSRTAKRKAARTPMSRRAFLANMGAFSAVAPLAVDPLRIFLASIMGGLIDKAEAAESGTTPSRDPTRYFFLGFQGAPSRWTFDNILGVPVASGNPASSIVQNNTHIITGFDNAGAPAYLTTPVMIGGKPYLFPRLWGQQMPAAGSGTTPMSSLLESLVIVRGIHGDSDGHEENMFKQLRPSQAGESIQGSHAGHSHALVPLVGLSSNPAGDFLASFNSKTGIGQFVVNPSGSNPLQDLLGAFLHDPTRSRADFTANRAQLDTAINSALAALGDYSKSGRRGASALFDNAGSAATLFKRSFGDLAERWNDLVGKYRQLVQRSMEPIPGVTDRPILLSSYANDPNAGSSNPSSKLSYSEHAGASIKIGCFGITDFCKLIGPDSTPAYLAEIFAVTEFLFKEDLTKTVMGVSPYFFNFNTRAPVLIDSGFHNITGTGSSRTGDVKPYHYDQHWTGGVAAAAVTSHMYMAMASCIGELKSEMKSAKLWDNMVVQIGADFGREPKSATDFEGTNHGFRGHQLTMFTGLTTQPVVTGNILKDSGNGKGTWGEAAQAKLEVTPAYVNLGNAISTVASLLGTDSPTENFPSVLRVAPAEKKIYSKIGDPTNV